MGIRPFQWRLILLCGSTEFMCVRFAQHGVWCVILVCVSVCERVVAVEADQRKIYGADCCPQPWWNNPSHAQERYLSILPLIFVFVASLVVSRLRILSLPRFSSLLDRLHIYHFRLSTAASHAVFHLRILSLPRYSFFLCGDIHHTHMGNLYAYIEIIHGR